MGEWGSEQGQLTNMNNRDGPLPTSLRGNGGVGDGRREGGVGDGRREWGVGDGRREGAWVREEEGTCG